MGFVKTQVCTARADVVIGPYEHFTCLHWCIRFCNIVPHGRGRTPPLRAFWGILRVRRGCVTFRQVVPRADRVVRPYRGAFVFALVRKNLQHRTAREGQAPPLRYDEKRTSMQTDR